MKRARHPKDVVTRERAADMAVQRTIARLNTWASVAMTVGGIIDFVRQMVTEDLPMIARDLLRRIGLDYQDDDELSIEGLQGVLSRQTGIEFHDITNPAQIRADIEEHLLDKIEEATGVRFTALKASVMRAEIAALLHDRVATIAAAGDVAAAVGDYAAPALLGPHLPGRVVRACREAHRHGLSGQLGASMTFRLQAWNHRKAQARYALTCSEYWLVEDIVSRVKIRGRIRVIVKAQTVRRTWGWNKKNYWGKIRKGLLPEYQMRGVNELTNVGLDWRFPVEMQQRFLTLSEANKVRIRSGLRPLRRKDWDGRRSNGNPNIRGNPEFGEGSY